MKMLGKILLAILTGVLFFLSVFWLFESAHLAFILTLSVLLHEMGHAIPLIVYGHTVSMFFVPFLGAAVSMDKEKMDSMNQWQLAFVALAGPAVNVVLVVVAFLLMNIPEWRNDMLAVASVNASLAVYNLIPFAFLDGGRFAKALFHSTDEATDQIISVLISGIAAILGLTLVFISGKFSFFYLLIYLGIRHESKKDDPHGHLSPAAMTKEQSYRMLAFYMCMLFSMWIANFLLPAWRDLYK